MIEILRAKPKRKKMTVEVNIPECKVQKCDLTIGTNDVLGLRYMYTESPSWWKDLGTYLEHHELQIIKEIKEYYKSLEDNQDGR